MNIDDFSFVIDKEYVSEMLKEYFETDFTEEEWREFYQEIGQEVYPEVQELIGSILKKRNKKS